MYFVFSSLILTSAVEVCYFNGTFTAACGYGRSLKLCELVTLVQVRRVYGQTRLNSPYLCKPGMLDSFRFMSAC